MTCMVGERFDQYKSKDHKKKKPTKKQKQNKVAKCFTENQDLLKI